MASMHPGHGFFGLYLVPHSSRQGTHVLRAQHASRGQWRKGGNKVQDKSWFFFFVESFDCIQPPTLPTLPCTSSSSAAACHPPSPLVWPPLLSSPRSPQPSPQPPRPWTCPWRRVGTFRVGTFPVYFAVENQLIDSQGRETPRHTRAGACTRAWDESGADRSARS